MLDVNSVIFDRVHIWFILGFLGGSEPRWFRGWQLVDKKQQELAKGVQNEKNNH